MAEFRFHGSTRGSDNSTRSRSFEGRFGRMFRNLPPAELTEEDIIALSKEMVPEADPVPETKPDPAESTIPAGYTYLGQFIAHDLTFDPVSSLQHDNDPDALVDFRSPRFDLDSLYGRGPADQPYLYEEDGSRLVMGRLLDDKKSRDVPRSPAQRAIIGDPRNDENVILAQLHALFMRFHNRLASKKGARFAETQRLVRWHYQWVVLYDYLSKIVNPKTYFEVLSHRDKKSDPCTHPPQLRFYRVRDEAYMPIEFSAAAFRFGHSMVRHRYRLNRDNDRGKGGPLSILGEEDGTVDLRGFHLFRPDWFIEWDLFFEGLSAAEQRELTKDRVQPAFKIDTVLSDPMSRLPTELTKGAQRPIPSLAERNLIRGWRDGLPSGQAVARLMGIDPVLTNDKLTVGKDHKPLTEVSPGFKHNPDNAPLWYYILAEADQVCGGNQLGPVGGRILMEVFVGLMLHDGYSFLRQWPLWKPDKGYDFNMTELIKEAMQA